MSRRMLAMLLATGAIAIGGIVFALVGAVFVMGEAADGVVVEQKEHRGTCAPVVRYTAGGQEHVAAMRVRTSGCGWEAGDRVTVYYWPDSPADPMVPAVSTFLVPGLIVAGMLGAAGYLARRRG